MNGRNWCGGPKSHVSAGKNELIAARYQAVRWKVERSRHRIASFADVTRRAACRCERARGIPTEGHRIARGQGEIGRVCSVNSEARKAGTISHKTSCGN